MIQSLFFLAAMAAEPLEDYQVEWVTDTLTDWNQHGTVAEIPEDNQVWVPVARQMILELWFRDQAAWHATDALQAAGYAQSPDSNDVDAYITGALQGHNIPVHWIVRTPDGPRIKWTTTMGGEMDTVMGWPGPDQLVPPEDPTLTPLTGELLARWQCREAAREMVESGEITLLTRPINFVVIDVTTAGVKTPITYVLPSAPESDMVRVGATSAVWCPPDEPPYVVVESGMLMEQPKAETHSIFMMKPALPFPMPSFGFQGITAQMPVALQADSDELWLYDDGDIHFLGRIPPTQRAARKAKRRRKAQRAE